MFDSGDFARTDEHRLAALVVAAFLAVAAMHGMAEAPSASADTSATLVCSKQGQDATGLYGSSVSDQGYQTADGHFAANVDIATGTPNSIVPECNSAAPVADAGRATGQTQGRNPGADGQCTWGAAQKWFEASGSYPALFGNALAWGDSATASGWTVVDEPRERSIVVFQPGVAGAGSIGHVAWVDSVSQGPGGKSIHITEMNNSYLGGVGIFNDRDVDNVPGMTYILLP